MTDPSAASGGWSVRPVPPRPAVHLGTGGGRRPGCPAGGHPVAPRSSGRVPLIVASAEVGGGGVDAARSVAGLSPVRTSSDATWRDPTRPSIGCPRPRNWAGPARRPSGMARQSGRRRRCSSPLPCPTTCPAYTWGERARIAIRADRHRLRPGRDPGGRFPGRGPGRSLGSPPVSLSADELSYLGCVLVLRRVEGGRHRVVAAHYVRPFVRDTHGHTQRLGPAVLATWDATRDVLRGLRLGDHPGAGLPDRRTAGRLRSRGGSPGGPAGRAG